MHQMCHEHCEAGATYIIRTHYNYNVSFGMCLWITQIIARGDADSASNPGAWFLVLILCQRVIATCKGQRPRAKQHLLF